MEDLIITSKEHKILRKFQKRLQKRFKVKIQMPNLVTSTESDVIFVSIFGETRNIESVKNFLSEQTSMTTEKVEYKENVLLITLSDSEEEPVLDLKSKENTVSVVNDLCQSSTNLVDEIIMVNPLDSPVCDIESPVISKCSSKSQKNSANNGSSLKEKEYDPLDSSVCIIESPIISKCSSKYLKNSANDESSLEIKEYYPLDSSVCIIESPIISKCTSRSSVNNTNDKSSLEKEKYDYPDNSVCIIESPEITDCSLMLSKNQMDDKSASKNIGEHMFIKRKNKKVRSKGTLPSSDPFEDSKLCEVSSTTREVVPKKRKFSEDIGGLTQELAEFIPLHKKKKCRSEEMESSVPSHGNSSKEERNDDILIIDNPTQSTRPLRPIVIDGSNVAIEHGKVSHVFSSKGIQLAVDYFLNRGHTQVTAFIPRFRRFCNRKNFPTTDPEILDDLASKQHVVFTPSRRINGKCIASYDDRFIVQLASTNGGVIVSNDNYRDLISENDSFKEVIENRLLMFCFVGDIFMIPSDPLGRNGPSLNDFLSFPPDS